MAFTLEKRPAFTIHMKEFRRCGSFSVFTVSHIPRDVNIIAYKLAKSARIQHTLIVYIDTKLLV